MHDLKLAISTTFWYLTGYAYMTYAVGMPPGSTPVIAAFAAG
jgi:hypothetical protein